MASEQPTSGDETPVGRSGQTPPGVSEPPHQAAGDAGLRAQLLHLSGPLRGRTITYREPQLLIGSQPGAGVRLAGSPAVVPHHARLTFHAAGCEFVLERLDGRVFVNQQEIEEVILQPADVIEFGAGGPKARFRIWAPPGAVCKPVRLMLRDALDVGRSSGVAASTWSLVRDLLTQASLQLKLGVPAFVLLVLLPLAYFAGFFGGTRASTQRYEEKLADVRRDLGALRAARTELSPAEVERIRDELAKSSAVIERWVRADAAVKRVLSVYTRGVCLLHGVYGFVKPQGEAWSWLGGSGSSRLVVEYLGSGFLIDPSGHVATNRHVAEPWWNNAQVATVIGLGYTPRFLSLTATFPGQPPLPVDTSTVRLRRDDIDVAVLQIDLAGRDIPVLPLHTGDLAALRGERVVVLGYPTGVNALLAKTEPDVMREIAGLAPDLTAIIAELARRQAIGPIATQGALNDVLERRLVFDAETTSGGSGGPVFDAQGSVIGISFAVMPEFGGANFGIPVRYAVEILQ